MTEIFLPQIPQTFMFMDKDGEPVELYMNMEWQEFFRKIHKRSGGVDSINLDELTTAFISSMFNSPQNYKNDIEEFHKKLTLIGDKKSYDNAINALEKLIYSLNVCKDYDNLINNIEKTIVSDVYSILGQHEAKYSEKTWSFSSPTGSSGTSYYGGYYKLASSDNDFNPLITFGTANAAYGAHLFLVQVAGGGGGTDTVIRITGTSITDNGTRTPADTEDITVDDAGAADTYYETSKKWIGQVSIEKQSGPDLLCNYGFCKYWDNNNNNFIVVGVDVTWLGGANDATPDIKLRHHKTTGWTYNNGAAATPPSELISMATDYNTEIQVVNGEEGAWKRSDLHQQISGGSSEGTIIEVITTANKAFESGNLLLRIKV